MRHRLRTLLQYAPTRRYAALVALAAPVWLAAGSTPGNITIALVMIALVFAVVVDASHLPGEDQLALHRTVNATMGVREPEPGRYTIRSHATRTVELRLTHAVPPAIDAPLPGSAFILAPDDTVIRPFIVQGLARGRAPLGKVALTIQTSLGLAQRNVIYDLNDTISIIPSLTDGRRYRLAAVQRQMRTPGERALRQRGQGTAFSNLREYAVGDDPRHIDWKASARRNRLISRQYTIEQGQNIVLAVDAGRLMAQIAGDRPRLEYALAAALTLADVALTAGDRVGLLIFNEEVRNYVPPGRGQTTLTQIRHALTGVTATLAEPDYAAAFRTLAERQRRRSLVVIFTDVIDLRSSRAILAHTTHAALRHLPLVVALRNEQLATVAVPPIGGNDLATYQSVAAEELLSARDEVLQNMRQAGVNVIDTPPTAMTAAVVNRYLAIKERAAL